MYDKMKDLRPIYCTFRRLQLTDTILHISYFIDDEIVSGLINFNRLPGLVDKNIDTKNKPFLKLIITNDDN